MTLPCVLIYTRHQWFNHYSRSVDILRLLHFRWLCIFSFLILLIQQVPLGCCHSYRCTTVITFKSICCIKSIKLLSAYLKVNWEKAVGLSYNKTYIHCNCKDFHEFANLHVYFDSKMFFLHYTLPWASNSASSTVSHFELANLGWGGDLSFSGSIALPSMSSTKSIKCVYIVYLQKAGFEFRATIKR